MVRYLLGSIGILVAGGVNTYVMAAELEPGATFRDCSDCPEMVVIPAGSFEMGSEFLNQMRDNEMRPEGPIHTVTIAKPFAAGKFEVTHAQYAQFVEETGYTPATSCVTWEGRDPLDNVNWTDPKIGPLPKDDEPVVCVSWNDARSYTAWLAGKTGQPYRLLSEAEWEYVAKAGSDAAWPWGDDVSDICDYGNVFDQTGKTEPRSAQNDNASARAAACDDGYMLVAPVGQFKPNAFGLYDTIGNVWEWVQDCSIEYYEVEPADGSAYESPNICEKRAVRSGSWRSRVSRQRTTFRGRDPADLAYYMFGLRLARDLN